MKFLVDNCLSPSIARDLSANGHDATHVRDYGIAHASDQDVLRKAAVEGRILITADADFGLVLALWRQPLPSVILLRGLSQRRPDRQSAMIIANIAELRESLERGSFVVVEDTRVRIRALPLPG